MIHPGHGVKIFVATSPVDFRKGHDGLAALVQSHLRHKPFDGAVYVFRAKRADRLKLIYWDGSGLVMYYKRLEQNSFKWPKVTDGVMRLDPAQFEALLPGSTGGARQPERSRHQLWQSESGCLLRRWWLTVSGIFGP